LRAFLFVVIPKLPLWCFVIYPNGFDRLTERPLVEFAKSKDGVCIAYETIGDGTPILLIHGFASNRFQNWKNPGWYETLTTAGYQVIAMDCRGHGESDKPHDPSAYDHELMAGDALAVVRAAGAEPVHLMGYSMGGFIGMRLLLQHSEILRKVVIAGVGETYLKGQMEQRGAIADALLEPDKSKLTDPTAKAFRLFAEQPGKDLLALAACMRGNRKTFSAEELRHSTRSVLVVCGENDTLTGSPEPLAAAFADGHAVTVARRDHMTTVGDKAYKQAVLSFLAS
jgi:pimeloyl-ACP methyl ester carboxylesterase